MSKASLKNLFKTGDVITETNMATLVDETSNEVSELVTVDTNIPGIKANYIAGSDIYNVYL